MRYAAGDDLDAAGLGELVVPVLAHVPRDREPVAGIDAGTSLADERSRRQGVGLAIVGGPFLQ